MNARIPPPTSVPPPSPALMAAVVSGGPVRTRNPRFALAAVLGVGALFPVLTVAWSGTAPHLAQLPSWWVVSVALVWAAAAALLSAWAILPARGHVLPDPRRAARAAIAVAAVLIAVGLFGTLSSPGHAHTASSAWDAWLQCTSYSLKVTVPVLVVAGFALRGLHPVGATGIAAAAGATGGALAGLALHFVCRYGEGLHVALAHGGGVVLAAVAGALLLTRFLRA